MTAKRYKKPLDKGPDRFYATPSMRCALSPDMLFGSAIQFHKTKGGI